MSGQIKLLNIDAAHRRNLTLTSDKPGMPTSASMARESTSNGGRRMDEAVYFLVTVDDPGDSDLTEIKEIILTALVREGYTAHAEIGT